ncbi:MAG: hypothetical protein QRY71_02960 [Candidatus Rhabdochlamydia sp.]
MTLPLLQELNAPVRIGIDLMGSDTPPLALIQTLLELAKNPLSPRFSVFLHPSLLSYFPPYFHLIPCSQTVHMQDDPKIAFKTKKESSLLIGLKYLAEGSIDGLISAGNTGALVLSAKRILTSLPGIERPSLLAQIPTQKNEIVVLDVGANLTLKPRHMVQLAKMGTAFQQTCGIKFPTVGLLNIGIEPAKGTLQHRNSLKELLSEMSIYKHFQGNVESQDVFNGKVDVVVTDGLMGNMFLKTAESAASFLLHKLSSLQENTEYRSLLTSFHTSLSSQEKRSAILCGTKGLIIKCHGNLAPLDLKHSIQRMTFLIQSQFLSSFCTHLLHLV